MAEKKVLIITYYWPPAGGPGVQRWLKFVKYLPEFGWQPTVFIPENPDYPLGDETLATEVSQNLPVLTGKIWEPYQLAEFFGKSNKKFKAGQFDVGAQQSLVSKFSIWIRGNFFIPDARIFWVKPSVKILRQHLRENTYEAIVTTGPPHSVHLIGLKLKKIFPKLLWVADFRDPWTEISYYKHLKLSSWADKKHRNLEAKVFRTADLTLATSFTDAENFKAKGANAVTLTNGFDELPLMEKKSRSADARFILNYTGVLEQLRSPTVLWKVLAELSKQDEDFRRDLLLRFVGRVDAVVLKTIFNYLTPDQLEQTGYLPHSEAVGLTLQSDLLLLTNFPQEASRGIIPGKIFEYLATGKQILSFGPENSDVQKILSETGGGHHFGFKDSAELKTYILQRYYLWKGRSSAKANPEIQKYSRRSLTQKLAEILDKAVLH